MPLPFHNPTWLIVLTVQSITSVSFITEDYSVVLSSWMFAACKEERVSFHFESFCRFSPQFRWFSESFLESTCAFWRLIYTSVRRSVSSVFIDQRQRALLIKQPEVKLCWRLFIFREGNGRLWWNVGGGGNFLFNRVWKKVWEKKEP